MAKETIYLTSAVRLAGDDQDTPAGTEVSVEAADAEFLVDVARVATREKPAEPVPVVDARPLLMPDPAPEPEPPQSKEAAKGEAAAKVAVPVPAATVTGPAASAQTGAATPAPAPTASKEAPAATPAG